MFVIEHLGQKRTFLLTAAPELVFGVERGIDAAAEGLFGFAQGLEDIFEQQLVGDDQHIDIAAGMIAALRDGAVEQGQIDLVAHRGQRGPEQFGGPENLAGQAAEFFEDGRIGVGAIQSAAALTLLRDQADFGQPCGFSLDGPATGLSQVDELAERIAAVRVREEQTKQGLAGAGEQRVSQADAFFVLTRLTISDL